MHLLYLANARLPNEMAHGYQICKMCEAFALNGAEVTLLHPQQMSIELSTTSVFDYYGLRPVFRVQTLPKWNVEPPRANRWFKRLSFAYTLIWSWYASRKARTEKADIYYTRDITIV